MPDSYDEMGRICVVGGGYVGVTVATGLAKLGNDVTLVDIVPEKVNQINNGCSPFYEPGLSPLLKEMRAADRLRATTNLDEAIDKAQVTFICVGTPAREDGYMTLSYLIDATRDVAQALNQVDAYHTVVIKSTVAPGTTEGTFLPLIEEQSGKRAGDEFGLAMNPEFLQQGRALQGFLGPDRVVVGGIDDRSTETVCRLYEPLNCPIVRTTPATAEMVKYASNAFLATKISFINEIGNLCKRLGIDAYQVADAMGYDRRINRHFLNAGIGYGGSCFPKDVKALVAKGEQCGVTMRLLEATDTVNERQVIRMLELLRERLTGIHGKNIAVLGLSFKPGTDDTRGSPAIKLINALLTSGASVRVYDSQVENGIPDAFFNGVTTCDTVHQALQDADACLIVTALEELKSLNDDDFDRMRSKVIIEGRRILDAAGVTAFEGLCW